MVGLILVGLSFAVYGPHVAYGGFMLDDWAFGAEYETFGRERGLLSLADRLLNDPDALMSAANRPLGALYYASAYTAFGTTMALHLAWAVFLAGLVSTLVYVVLRTVGMERLHAGGISILLLVFPASDSTRLWPAAATSLVAIGLYLTGLLLGLLGVRSRGRRGWLLHVGALSCYALSLLQYEIAAGAIALSACLYLVIAPWRPVALRWAADVGVAALCLLYLRSTTSRPLTPVDEQVERLRNLQGAARALLTQLGVQDGPARVPFALVVLVLAAATVLACVLPRTDATRAYLRRWLVLAAVGAVAIGAGLVIFVASEDEFYSPLRPGIGNRTNAAAAIGFVVFMYAFLVVLGLLLARAAAAVGAAGGVKTVVAGLVTPVAVLLAVFWVYEVNGDRMAWDRAFAIQDRTVEVLRAEVPTPASGSTIYTFGMPGETAPLVYAFSTSWDLTGAVRIIWRDSSLRGIPSASVEESFAPNTAENSGIDCRRESVRPRGWLWRERDASPYGKTIFVDIPTRGARLIRSETQCRAAVAAFMPP